MSNKIKDDIFEFAIANEVEAYNFYMELAAKMDKAYMKLIFEEFAREEQGHKAKLESVRGQEVFKPSDKKVLDLKLGDYMVEVDPNSNIDYQGALILAMKKEKSAFKLYNDLASAAFDENARNLFLTLAQEEAKHKLRFEIEYDDVFLQEN